MHDYHFEETDIGKVFDLTIITRLFGLMRPYLKFLIVAVMFLIVAAGVEILYPYVTKIAIDDYIIKNGRKVTSLSPMTGFVEIDDTVYFATQKALEKIDAGLLRQ